MGAQACNELGWLQASSKIENLVITTSSNNWYHEPMVKKANSIKNLECYIWQGHPDV
jgi:hypothetical protein